MKRILVMMALLAMASMLSLRSFADEVKTVTGTSACAQCSGAVAGDCGLMLTDSSGMRWVLHGTSDSYKAAFKARMSGKKMTAVLAGDPVAKKAKDGKDYWDVKVTDVKIDA